MLRYLPLLMILCSCSGSRAVVQAPEQFFAADHSRIRYTGRLDLQSPIAPRAYQPGIYMEAVFSGPSCRIIIEDQQLWGNQNYLQIIVDGESRRMQTQGKIDTITVAAALANGPHRLLVCKNTEANIGWIAFRGLLAAGLEQLSPAPRRRIEFIGDSITCACCADTSEIDCGEGKWHDQHHAYGSYGATTARALDAQWHLSSVSGIGLIRSCCEMDVVFPPVYDNIDMRGDSLEWDFDRYHPDVVTICLGQNDGIQDSTAFCSAYVGLIEQIRFQHPEAQVVLLNSPMGDEALTAVLKNYLNSVVSHLQARGDEKVDRFFFSRQFTDGCDYHPSLAEHEEIAEELTGYLRRKMKW